MGGICAGVSGTELSKRRGITSGGIVRLVEKEWGGAVVRKRDKVSQLVSNVPCRALPKNARFAGGNSLCSFRDKEHVLKIIFGD